jgi:trimeric autotransporter adhesin
MSLRLTTILTFSAFILRASVAQPNLSETPRLDTWTPDGDVTTVLVHGQTAFIGGLFYRWKSPFSTGTFFDRRHTGAMDLQSGAPTDWDPQLAGFPISFVRTLAADHQSLFAGGTFDSAAGQSRRDLVQIDLAGNPMPLQLDLCCDNINTFPRIDSLALGNDRLFIAGGFSKVGGTPRNRLAAISLPNGKLLDWNPGPDGDPGLITFPGYDFFTLKFLEPQTIVVGGWFNEIAHQSRRSLAMIDAESGAATLWNPDVAASDGNAWVRALAVSDGILYVGGKFTAVNGEARTNLAAFNLASGELTDWNPAVFGWEVNQLLVVSNAVFVGGDFVAVNGLPRRNLAAVTQSSGALFNWAPNPDGIVKALAYAPNTLLVGGGFQQISGKEISNLAVFPEAGWSRLLGPKLSEGKFSFTLIGDEATIYQLDSSSDLTNWQTIFRGMLPNGKVPYSIPLESVRMFYRVLTP